MTRAAPLSPRAGIPAGLSPKPAAMARESHGPRAKMEFHMSKKRELMEKRAAALDAAEALLNAAACMEFMVGMSFPRPRFDGFCSKSRNDANRSDLVHTDLDLALERFDRRGRRFRSHTKAVHSSHAHRIRGVGRESHLDTTT